MTRHLATLSNMQERDHRERLTFRLRSPRPLVRQLTLTWHFTPRKGKPSQSADQTRSVIKCFPFPAPLVGLRGPTFGTNYRDRWLIQSPDRIRYYSQTRPPTWNGPRSHLRLLRDFERLIILPLTLRSIRVLDRWDCPSTREAGARS